MLDTLNASRMAQRNENKAGAQTTLVVVGFIAFALALVATALAWRSLRPSEPVPLPFTLMLVAFGACAWLAIVLYLRYRCLVRDRRELARLALIACKTDHAALITNTEGTIEWVNEGFTRASGYAPEEAIGRPPGALLLGPLHNINVIQKIRDAIATQKTLSVEMLCSHKRGHRYWLNLSLTPVLDDDDQLTHFVGIGSDITARKRAEDELNRVNRRNELLLNAAGEGIFGLDVQGAITFVNPAAARLTSWTPPELIGKPASTIIHQLRVNHLPGAQDDLFTGAAFIDGTVLIGDTDEFRRRDGTHFPVEYTSTQLREGDTLLGSVVVFRDITDRRQGDTMRARQTRQFAIRADVAFGLTSGDNLRNFLQRAMLAIVKHLEGAFARVWTFNVEDNMLELQASAGMYTHINGPHGRIPVGTFKVGKIVKEGVPQISHNIIADPDFVDREWILRERMASFIGYPLSVEGRIVGVMAMYSRHRLPEDALELMAAVADTIAQGAVRKRAEEKVLEQAALLDKSTDAIVVLDLNNRCTYWNKSAERLYGWEAREVFGRPAEQLIFRDRNYFEHAKATVLQHGEWHDESCQVAKGEKPVSVETRWTLVRDDAGQPRSILIVNTDISERKKIEAQFLRTQRMESIGTLAGGIAHDLNNVLSPVMMSVEILKSKLDDPQSKRMLAILETSARRGADMVKQVLTFARGVDGERLLLQPRHIIKDITKIIHDTFPKTIQLKTQIAESLSPIMGDATQLHQVLLNLTVNARDAMPNGGTISITAEDLLLDERTGAEAGGLKPGAYVLIKVADNGTGIPKEILEKIFEPFFTTKEMGKGTGLGLSTVLGIVKSHGGVVQVQTEINKGTTFLVYLPAQQNARSESAEAIERQLPTGHGELILAVDDEASVLTMTKETLEMFGYRVLTARDGAEAVATYTAHKDEIKGVLTDMLMPHMDGPATIRVLKKLDPGVRVIAASGLMDGEKVKDATGLENIAFLMKPYTAEKLVTTLHRVLTEAA